MRRVPSSRRGSAGFSLIELMVGLVVGLVVAGSALAFTVVTIRSYGENINSTRLTGDLTTAMNLVVGELRRAGYDAESVGRLFTDNVPSSFAEVKIDGSCVSYLYDRGVGALGGAPDATEYRAIRLNTGTGALEMQSASANGCDYTGTWNQVTDPRVVNITAFVPALSEVPFCTVVNEETVSGTTLYDRVEGDIREVSLQLTGALRTDSSLSRTLENASRVRADRIKYLAGQTTGC